MNVSFKPEIANAYIAGNRVRDLLALNLIIYPESSLTGQQKKSNSIRAWVRTGPSRTKQDYDDLAEQVAKAWKDTVGTQGTEKLGAIFVLGDVLAAHESGLLVPRAGEEPEWVKQNYAEFQELAKDEQTFRDLIEELQTRECFKGLVPPTH